MLTVQPPYLQDFESTSVRVPTDASGYVAGPKPVTRLSSVQSVYSDQIFDNALTREAQCKNLRLERLIRLRNLWAFISLVGGALLIMSLYAKLAYEPAAAFLACSVGLLSVFVMKVGDARR